MTDDEWDRLMDVVYELEEAAEVLEKEGRRLPLQTRFLSGLSSGMLAGADKLLRVMMELDDNGSQRPSAEANLTREQYYNMVTMEDEFRD